MNMILGIFSGESYSSIRALADLSVCINKYQQCAGLSRNQSRKTHQPLDYYSDCSYSESILFVISNATGTHVF
jgi:hypothetical protein